MRSRLAFASSCGSKTWIVHLVLRCYIDYSDFVRTDRKCSIMPIKSPLILLLLCFSTVHAFAAAAAAQFWLVTTMTPGAGATKTATITTAMKATVSLSQFAPDAASLFRNMITPASIMAGGALGLASQIDFHGAGDDPKENNQKKKETRFAQVLRKIFPLICVASFTSHLLVVVWASVAVNQLSENKPAVAESVWHLIQRDYALEWAAVNGHFVLGLLGFLWLVATKAYFMGGQGPMGQSAFTLALSAMLVAVSIVNRGIAKGGGAPGLRFGSSVIGLLHTYLSLFYQRSLATFSPVEWAAVALALASLFNAARFMIATFLKTAKTE
jgi:hypothetical protein